jgi:hypothetical protein
MYSFGAENEIAAIAKRVPRAVWWQFEHLANAKDIY